MILPPFSLPGEILPHFSSCAQTGKGELPQRLEYGDGNGIAEVQTPGIGTHGNADTGIKVFLQKGFRKTLGLFSKEQIALIVILRLGIAPGSFCGQAPHLLYLVAGKEVVQILIIQHFHHMPVVQSRPADGLF